MIKFEISTVAFYCNKYIRKHLTKYIITKNVLIIYNFIVLFYLLSSWIVQCTPLFFFCLSLKCFLRHYYMYCWVFDSSTYIHKFSFFFKFHKHFTLLKMFLTFFSRLFFLSIRSIYIPTLYVIPCNPLRARDLHVKAKALHLFNYEKKLIIFVNEWIICKRVDTLQLACRQRYKRKRYKGRRVTHDVDKIIIFFIVVHLAPREQCTGHDTQYYIILDTK